MNAEQLKSSILQYALEGKLVPQNPIDEPAENLMKRVREERKRLILEKVIKKGEQLPPISEDEIPFEIPECWKWVRIEECGAFLSGYTPKGHQLSNEGEIPYFKVSDMNTEGNEKYLLHSKLFLNKEIQNPRVYLKNTIVYPKNGGAVFTNKKRILVKNSVIDLNTGGFFPFPSLHLEYIYLFFSNLDFKQYYKGTALPTLDMTKLKSILIPIPPIEEQKRITEKIKEFYNKADEYSIPHAQLEGLQNSFPSRLEKSILQYAIQGKLVPQDPNDEPTEKLLERIKEVKDRLIKEKVIKKGKPLNPIAEEEIPFKIPDSWRWTRLGDIALQITDGVHKTPTYINNGIPFLSVKNISQGYLDLENTKFVSKEEHELMIKRCKPEKGDILFCRIGTLGKPLLLKQEVEFSIFVSLGLLKLIDKSIAPFIEFVMKSPMFYEQIEKVKVSGSHTNKINLRDVPNLLVPLPPIPEQKRILDKAEEFFDSTKKLLQ